LYASRGFVTVASILSYVGALSSMSVLIRNVYVGQNFKYPQFLTATHFVATAMVGASILLYRNLIQGQKATMKILGICFDRCIQEPGDSLAFKDQECIWQCTQRLFEYATSAKPWCKDGRRSLIMSVRRDRHVQYSIY